MTKRRRALILGSIAAALLLAVVGIGSAGVDRHGGAAAVSSLRSACGSKIVVQTDWFPEPEHAASYQLAGTHGTFDKAKGRYTGEIGNTGVQLEIRAGGPFTGFQQPISQMYQDSSITLGYVNSDEAIRSSKTLPTVAIVSPLEFSPQILMWNPQKLTIKSFADIAKTNAKVLVFEGGVWVDYLIGKGWVNKSQVDTSYDGSPARFISTDGNIVQHAFATSEPYDYQHVITQYGKPVSYLLLRNSGYVPYPESLAAKPDVVKKMAPCFKLLVPLYQKAEVAYMKNPGPTNAKLVDIVTQLNTFWKLTPGGVAYNAATQKRLKIVQNGPDCTLGNFSMTRLQGVINQLLPIYREQNLNTFVDNVKPSSIATNRFIDKKVGLPKKGCK
jgi:hypothetical protein